MYDHLIIVNIILFCQQSYINNNSTS